MLVGIANDPCVRLHDGQPSQNIQPSRADDLGSVLVRMFRVAAPPTNKQTLRLSVRLFDVAALATLLAGVLRIDENSEDSASRRFIDDEVRELRECPAVQSVALIAFSPYPVTDAVEFL